MPLKYHRNKNKKNHIFIKREVNKNRQNKSIIEKSCHSYKNTHRICKKPQIKHQNKANMSALGSWVQIYHTDPHLERPCPSCQWSRRRWPPPRMWWVASPPSFAWPDTYPTNNFTISSSTPMPPPPAVMAVTVAFSTPNTPPCMASHYHCLRAHDSWRERERGGKGKR